MKYIKTINNIPTIKSLNNIILHVNGKQIINPTEEMVLADGWSPYQEVTPEWSFDALEVERQNILDKIDTYDNSSAVNNCVIKFNGNSINYWANKSERSILKTAVQDCILMGRDEYRLDLRDLGVYVSINCQQLLQMLSALEVYAIDCYNKTTDHIYNVNALTTIEELQNYDYKEGYPENLVFNLSLVG